MKKIKFKIEYVPLSDERIERHKDFDKLMSAYTAHPKPDWKTRWFGNKLLVYTTGIITGAAIASLIWWNINRFDEHKLSSQQNSVENTKSNTEQVQGNPSTRNISRDDSQKNPLEKKQKENESTVAMKDSVNELDQLASKQNEIQKEKVEVPLGKNAISSAKGISPTTMKEGEEISAADTKTKAKQSKNKSAKNEKSGSAVSSSKSNKESPGKKSIANSSGKNSSPDISSKKKIHADTLALKSKSNEKKDDVPLSSLPPDSSKKGIHVTLPKIDLNETINAISDAADSVGKKIDTLVAQIFKKDSTNSEKAGKEESHVKIDLKEPVNAISNAVDSIGKKVDSLFAHAFPKDSSKGGKQQKEISSQSVSPDSFKHRYAQLSFISPLSTDGANAKYYMHNISFNVLQGYTGALEGVEIGGLANFERGYVKGVQFGGLVNFALGDLKGVQFGGLVNHAKNISGAQFSGLVSSATGSLNGAQVGGILNFALDTFEGLQIGGVANLALGNKPSIGWQIAGVTNVSLGNLQGGQLSGVFNVASKLSGTQIGLINFSKKISGFQLGLINIADSINGDALGLFSVSVNGMHHLDVFGSEILYGSVALKLGSPHIYNIFAAGVAPVDTIARIGFGIGLGGHFSANRFFINVDGMCWTIHNNTLRDWNYVNLWNQIRLMAGFQFTKGFAAYAGPTANAHVYHNTYPSIAPYTSYQHVAGTNVDGWIGFVVGLQFF